MELFLFFLFLPIIFVITWLGICLTILFMSGYLELSEYYKVGLIYKRPLTKAKLAVLGLINLQNALELGIYPEGLYLAIAQIFQIRGAKLLLISWSNIEISEMNDKKITLKLKPKNIQLIIKDKEICKEILELFKSET